MGCYRATKSTEETYAGEAVLRPAIISTVEDVMTRLAAQVALEADVIAETRALIVEAYLAENSLREIAELTKLSKEGVRKILNRAGVELRGRGRPSKTDP